MQNSTLGDLSPDSEEIEQEMFSLPDYDVKIPEPPQAASTSSPISIGIALAFAFAAGLFLGLLTRPMLIQDVPIQVVVTVVPNSSSGQAVAVQPPPATTDSSGNPATDGSSEAATQVDPNATPTPTLMEFVLADARHFQGEETAPIKIVEFSDFK